MPISSEPRILSVRQPFAWAILSGRKKVENRDWTTAYRGPVFIHAGMRYHDEGAERITRELGVRIPPDLPRGVIAGVVELIDVITEDPKDKYKGWFSGAYGFVLAKPRILPKPIPIPGRLGLYRAAPEIIREIKRQLGGL